MPLPVNHAPPCLLLGIKYPLKEEEVLLPWDVKLLLFAWGFLVWETFGREKNC
jgi:hypothetical protein